MVKLLLARRARGHYLLRALNQDICIRDILSWALLPFLPGHFNGGAEIATSLSGFLSGLLHPIGLA